MQKLVEIFTEIGKIITSVVEFVIDFFKGLLEFTTSLPDYIELATSYINAMPTAVKTVAVMTFSVTLIFIVIGRRGR